MKWTINILYKYYFWVCYTSDNHVFQLSIKIYKIRPRRRNKSWKNHNPPPNKSLENLVHHSLNFFILFLCHTLPSTSTPLSLSLLAYFVIPCLHSFFGFFCSASAISHHQPFQVPPPPWHPFRLLVPFELYIYILWIFLL